MNLAPFAGVRTWIFDLDNTLYPASAGLVRETGTRMRSFLRKRLNLDDREASRIQREYFFRYGSTLAGVVRHHALPAEDYLEHVYDIDLSGLAPNPALGMALAELSGRKLLFTNASRGHAERVLDRLGVRKHFPDIFAITDSGLVGKPALETYARLVDRYDVDPSRAAMFEDIPGNLRPAARLGMRTVWVRDPSGPLGDHDPLEFDHATEDLVDLLGTLGGSTEGETAA